MDDLATALAGRAREHARAARAARRELERGARELAPSARATSARARRRRRPATAPARRRARAPALRADPDAVNERTWLLVAALVGALVEVAGAGTLRAGALGGHLASRSPATPTTPSSCPLAFEDHVEGVDRLRARALPCPASVLADVDDLRDPIGAAHPLVVAAASRPSAGARPTRLDGGARGRRPRALDAAGGPSRPHDDPDPARRVARRILQRLDGMGQVGRLPHGVRPPGARLRRQRPRAGRGGGRGAARRRACWRRSRASASATSSSTPRAGDIHALIERGEAPADLALPR
jgi:hypothetical protein